MFLFNQQYPSVTQSWWNNRYLVCIRVVIFCLAIKIRVDMLFFFTFLNWIIWTVSKEIRNKMEVGSNVFEYQSILYSSRSERLHLHACDQRNFKKVLCCISDSFNAAMVIHANENICKKSACLDGNGFLFLYCQTQSKTITCITTWRKYLQLY